MQALCDRIIQYHLPWLVRRRKTRQGRLRGHEARSVVDIEVVRRECRGIDRAIGYASIRVRTRLREEVVRRKLRLQGIGQI